MGWDEYLHSRVSDAKTPAPAIGQMQYHVLTKHACAPDTVRAVDKMMNQRRESRRCLEPYTTPFALQTMVLITGRVSPPCPPALLVLHLQLRRYPSHLPGSSDKQPRPTDMPLTIVVIPNTILIVQHSPIRPEVLPLPPHFAPFLAFLFFFSHSLHGAGPLATLTPPLHS